ncbi:MAG TPA: SDR family NAD(P)-dependent oxidoreductase [Sphingomonadaceae bacterium]|jgi:NAD(P)-dependent dehydrogenase (short-subunit alcohol dehydrogenase family)|nr:SDR family NAD(P)-dependent oxidoreductase [Sphingomonadaceae bacterium]
MTDPSDKPSDETRRALIGGTALVAGAAMLGTAGPADAQAARPAVPGAVPGTLTGKVALVTGAGRGIGRAVARGYAASGADVAVLDIAQDIDGHAVPMARPADLEETARLIRAQGRRALVLRADIRDLEAMKAAVARTERELGPLYAVVANAGVNSNTKFADDDEAAFRRSWDIVTDVNVKGTAHTLRAALPGMIRRREGRAIVTASTFGRQGSDINPAYAASKWAAIGLIKSAAIEAGPSGVTVNGFAPTATRTGLGGSQTPEQRAAADTWLKANYHKMDVGVLEPEDMIGAAVWLASPGARWVSGQVIDVAAGANARWTA